jgi:ADP-heptose:LPS heptosyltransferase
MVSTILVYSMGELIGDGLIKLPFVGGLRRAFPKAHIAWAAAKGDTVYDNVLKPIVSGAIDEVVTAGPTGTAARDLLPWVMPFDGRKFDLVIDTQENLSRAAVARRAARGGGVFISPAGGFRLSQRRPEPGDPDPWPVAIVDRFAKLLSLAVGEPQALAPLEIVRPRLKAAAEALLPPGPTYVGIAPGAGGQDKRWMLYGFLEIAKRQLERGRTPVFFFGPDEAEEAASAYQTLEGKALMPEWNRQDAYPDIKGPALVVALAGRLAGAVANDAGPGHMFAAGGAPLVSLQTDHRRAAKFRPAASRLEMLVAEDYGAGMNDLPIDIVDAALERLLTGAA